MTTNIKNRFIVSMLVLISCSALMAQDECPCAGGTEPSVGFDACQKPVCDEALIAKSDELCCGGSTVYKKNEISLTQTIDLSALTKIYNDTAGKIGGAFGVNFAMSGPATFSGTGKKWNECCNNTVTELGSFKFSGNITGAGVSVNVPMTAAWVPPQVAGIRADLRANLSMGISVDYAQTCTNPKSCSNLTGNLNVYGGITGYIGNEGYELVSISGGFGGQTSGGFQYCTDKGSIEKVGALCVTPYLAWNIKLAGVINLVSGRHDAPALCM
ncbi:MAG: hypothetical protein H2172_18475 [Opitutus sp.]|nr:hypothetical protein [Opitutus sp.]MCS6274846.1 hypothetical protein [Opitutus sp.]MCS6278397.1 hypothetical protein [Opitutus sp.]MCS6299507.1 hypothetical protein [Opitutus sp.]